jgi:hypothetical protein
MFATGSGPLGDHRRGTYDFDANVSKPHTPYLEESPKRVGERTFEDVAFAYPKPRPEAVKRPGTVGFFGEGVDIRVDEQAE